MIFTFTVRYLFTRRLNTMKKTITITTLLFCLIAITTFIYSSFASSPTNKSPQPIAVIELFTSQGCSSCPAADKLLSQTITEAKENGKKIFALSFHVDYWNRLGWADPFSTESFSERQRLYAASLKLQSVYTPQMIVNGSSEYVGSSKSNLNNAIEKALKTAVQVYFKTLFATAQNGNTPTIKYELEGNYADCRINFALISLIETTNIKRGENGGRVLTNENVVRQLITVDAKSEGEINFEKAPLPKLNNYAIIAFVQQNNLKIIGAAMVEIK